jgi:hypothetical protein
MAVYRDQRALRHQVRHVVRHVRIIMLDHPGQMRMQETEQPPERRGAVQIGRMQVAFKIR